MGTIFEMIGRVVTAVGGAGVIIIAVSSYISKLWATFFMEREKQKYLKDIESYKLELQKELETTRRLNEEIIHKRSFIFDSEYRYYEEMIPKLIDLGDEIQTYMALKEKSKSSDDNNVLINVIKEKKDKASKAFFEFNDLLKKYAVFIEKDNYKKMHDYSYLCFLVIQEEESDCDDSDQVNWDEVLKENLGQMNSVIDFIRESIRK